MKEKIIEWLERVGIYSPRLRSQIAENAARIASGKQIDAELFNSWIESLDLTGVMNIGSYFLKCFEKEIRLNSFVKEEESAPAISSAPQSVEQVEQSWEDWKELIDGTPSRGVICSDDNNYVRAVSDGEGGLIYIDGTVSKKYKRLEDLEPGEQKELIETVRITHGGLSHVSEVIKLMGKHVSAS